MFMLYSFHKLVDIFSTIQMVLQNHLFHLLDGLVANAPYVMVIVFNTHQMIIMHHEVVVAGNNQQSTYVYFLFYSQAC